jgi:hypothetical protein
VLCHRWKDSSFVTATAAPVQLVYITVCARSPHNSPSLRAFTGLPPAPAANSYQTNHARFTRSSTFSGMRSLAFALAMPPRMLAGGGGGGGSNVSGSGVGGGRGPISRGRLPEFTASGGDRSAQDALVRELMWQAAQVGLTDAIDGKIAEFDAGAHELVSGML